MEAEITAPEAEITAPRKGPAKGTHGGTRNLDTWDDERVETFVQLIKDHYPALTGKVTARSNVWRAIHSSLLLKVGNDEF